MTERLRALACTGFRQLNDAFSAATGATGTAEEWVRASRRSYVEFAVAHARVLDLMYAQNCDEYRDDGGGGHPARRWQWITRLTGWTCAAGPLTASNCLAFVSATIGAGLWRWSGVGELVTTSGASARVPK